MPPDIRGLACVNYLPTWARDSSEMWLHVPEAMLRRELGFAAALGFRGVRVWLNCWGWNADPEQYTSNVRLVMDAAHDAGLGLVPVLFDSCGVEPAFGPATDEPLEQALAGWPRDHPSLAAIHGLTRDPRAHMLDSGALVRIPNRGEPITAMWEWFRPGPGYQDLGRDWEGYLTDIVGVVAGHEALVAIDVMNEPYVSQIGHELDTAPIDDFIVWAHGVVRRLAPQVPLTMGDNSLENFMHHDTLVGGDLQIVNFHEYVHDEVPFHQVESLRRKIEPVVAYAGERPVFMSECGTFPGMYDDDQLSAYRAELPVWIESGVAWAPFHLIAGYGFCALSALLYPNGTMRPAAMHLRRVLRGG